jgi:hypothetical protein
MALRPPRAAMMISSSLDSTSDRAIPLASVVRAELRCVLATLSLLMRGQIRMPRAMVGREIEFADGTRSQIYRETAMRDVATSPRVMLAVRFCLRLIGSSRVGHALFRFESLINTWRNGLRLMNSQHCEVPIHRLGWENLSERPRAAGPAHADHPCHAHPWTGHPGSGRHAGGLDTDRYLGDPAFCGHLRLVPSRLRDTGVRPS